MQKERERKTSRRVRVRVTRSFSLSIVAAARITALSRQRRVSCSRVVEDLVIGVDYVEMYSLFKSGVAFEDIVIQTGQPPWYVRDVYRDYKAGVEGQPVVSDVG